MEYSNSDIREKAKKIAWLMPINVFVGYLTYNISSINSTSPFQIKVTAFINIWISVYILGLAITKTDPPDIEELESFERECFHGR